MSEPRTASPVGRRRAAAALALALLLLSWPTLSAYETDQYSGRLTPVADSTELLNAVVNREIEDVVSGWKHGRNDKRLVREIFWRLGGLHWVDKVERWAMSSPRVKKVPTPKKESVYAGLPFRATRVVSLFGVGASLKVNGVLIGSDKFGHFLSQGRKYYRHYLKTGSHDSVARHGIRNESGFFGSWTTGVYSNADLVANYEGYLFFRGLLEDGVVAGKPAILAWEGERPVVQRPFDWADHVNDFWDEALNPSHYAPALQKHIVPNLRKLCPEYFSAPELYVPRDYEELTRLYADLGLKEALHNRLDHVCEDAQGDGDDE